MKRNYFVLQIIFLFLGYNLVNASKLQPEAATIWDAYFPDGGHRANSDRLFPVIPTIGYNSEASSQSFYFDTDVDLYKDGIATLHARGMKYYMFLELYWLEVGVDTLLATDPLITDPDFGAVVNLDGSVNNTQRSINRPAYRDFFIRCIKRGIDAGSDGIQIDMAGEMFIQSFDPDDEAAFVSYLKANHPSSVWTSQGIGNIDTLHYRNWLFNVKGFGSFPETFDLGAGDPPLAKYWLLFKIDQIQKSWKIISDSAKNYAQTKYNREFTIIGNNAYFGRLSQHGIATMGDVCGEYFEYTNRYPLKGTTTTLHKSLQAFGKRNLVWSVPWNDGECNCKNWEFDLHMMAESFASGGLAQFGGEKEERDKYAQYFNLVQTQRELLNSVSPKGEVGVILAMPTTVCAWGIMDPHYGAQLLMQDLGRSYEVVIGGTNLGWADTLKLSHLTKFEVVVLHEAISLTNNQITVLLDYVNQGGKLIVFGTGFAPGFTGAQDENGVNRNNSTWEALVTGSSRVSNYGSGKLALIREDGDAPDGFCRMYYRNVNSGDTAKETIAGNIINTVRTVINSLLAEENIRIDLPEKVTIFRSEDSNTNTMLYHLVSRDVDLTTRLHKTLLNKTVTFDLMSALSLSDSVHITIYNPENPEGIDLGNAVVSAGKVTVTIPSLFIWDMIKINAKESNKNAVVSGLRITNAQKIYKLSYNQKPEFAWTDVSNNQDEYQLQIWDNALFYGSPVYDSNWINSADTSYVYTQNNLLESLTYIARVRIKNASGDISDYSTTSFHINKRPTVPDHFYGISAVIETSANPAFWWSEAQDMEGDSLKYFWQLYTDNVYNNFTDSLALDSLYTSGYSVHIPGGNDGVNDTLKTAIPVDNYGFWWKVYAYDGIDASLPSRWARFTWDHIDDAPKAFDLINPANDANVKTNGVMVSFSWQNNGDTDPNSNGLNNFDLLLSESIDFSSGVQTFSCNPPRNFNPMPISGHKIIYWKVKANDKTGNSIWSNQTRRLFIDDGTNTAPSVPTLLSPAIGANADEDTNLKWQLSTDTQSDSIFYTLQIATNATFTSPIITQNDIIDNSAPDASISISGLLNKELLTPGITYYWRVRALDRYLNGTSAWSSPRNFVYATTVKVEEITNTYSYLIYPNPVKDLSSLVVPVNLIQKGDVFIFNSQSKLVLKIPIKSDKITIERKAFKTGVYFYEIVSDKGVVANGKFIVE